MWSIPYFRQLVPLFPRFLPEDVVRMALKAVPSEGVQRLSSIIDILQTESKAIWRAKKADLERRDEVLLEQVGRGKDLMSVLRRAIPYFFILWQYYDDKICLQSKQIRQRPRKIDYLIAKLSRRWRMFHETWPGKSANIVQRLDICSYRYNIFRAGSYVSATCRTSRRAGEIARRDQRRK